MEFTREHGTIDDVSVIKAVAVEVAARLGRKKQPSRPAVTVEILHGKVVARMVPIEFTKKELAPVLEAHEPDCEGLTVTVLSIASGAISVALEKRTDEKLDEPDERTVEEAVDEDAEEPEAE